MMAAEALRNRDDVGQLELYERTGAVRPGESPGQHHLVGSRSDPTLRPVTPLCAGCRAREARYGFRDEDRLERQRALCFECFRMEIARRQAIAARLARGWNAEQVWLPLSDTLDALHLRRRRAQIAARKAVGP